jgi:cupin fold WbuC family metalloprotein
MAKIRILDSAFLDRLAAEAAAAPRRRKNSNLHAANDYPCHRLFNALQPDTYIQPHRHSAPSKDETVVLLRGQLGLVEFDELGKVVAAVTIRPGMTVDIPHGTFHGWCCLEKDSVFFEAKAGPYVPLEPSEIATFAPPEGDPRAPAYLASLKSLFPSS